MQVELRRILESYVAASKQPFAGHPIADTMREAQRAVASAIPDANRYVITFSRGQGQFAEIPWIGIRRPDIASGFQKGAYVIYLFHRNMERLYLALALGIEHAQSGDTVEQRVERLRSKLDIPPEFLKEPVDLGARMKLGKTYEKACVCAKRYDAAHLPAENALASDLATMLKIYDQLKPFDFTPTLAKP